LILFLIYAVEKIIPARPPVSGFLVVVVVERFLAVNTIEI
jgi:hypothetical protein